LITLRHASSPPLLFFIFSRAALISSPPLDALVYVAAHTRLIIYAFLLSLLPLRHALMIRCLRLFFRHA